ncbi:MAG: ribosome maturation factor RimP [Alphaproteobacteria bacterium]|nr:ribosome maturation factor RimP [Alphaproteobacteria bacterium]
MVKQISANGTKTIENMIDPSVIDAGYDIVRVQFADERRKTLQIMIERRDRRPVTVDDCATVSRIVSTLLDVEDPVPGRYNLEVSSPGIDRPLVKVDDYERFAGFEATVETKQAFDGQKKFRGRISGVEGMNIQMDCDGESAELPFEDIRRASLVITDELIEAARREASAAAQTEH